MRSRPRGWAGLAALAVAALVSCPSFAAAQLPGEGNDARSLLPEPPQVDADGYLVFDATDDTTLAGRQIDTPQPIASLTKLMTALLIVENVSPDERVNISERSVAVANDAPGAAALGTSAGQSYKAEDLLRAMLVYSANDAAVALAEHVAQTERAFIQMMNERADRMNLEKTRFSSVTGLDTEQGSTSTPADLIELTRTALKDRRIAQMVRLKHASFPLPSGSITVDNRNTLLSTYPGVVGVKTGFTDDAGYCLIGRYADSYGADLYTVVLGSASIDAREAATAALLDWARANRPRVQLAEAGELVANVPVEFSSRPLPVFVTDDVITSVRIGEELDERIVVPGVLQRPIAAGEEVGRYELVVDGDVVASSPLYVDRGRGQLDSLQKARYYVHRAPRVMRQGFELVRSEALRQREQLGL